MLGRIKNTSMTIFLKGKLSSPSIFLNSDLDDMLNNAFKDQARKDKERIKKEIKAHIDQLASQHKKQIENALNSYKSKTNTEIKSQEKKIDKVKEDINTQKKVLESKQKDIEKKIKREKEKAQKELETKKKEVEVHKKAAE